MNRLALIVPTTRTPPIARRRHRGVSLLESLVACVVLAGTTLGATQVQRQMRAEGDVARQRAEAVRLAEEEIEHLRAFSAIAAGPGLRSYAAIADADAVGTQGASNTAYRVERRVDDAAFAGTKAVTVRVAWNDRGGAAHEVMLASFIAGSDPAYAGSLGLGTGTVDAAPRGVGGRAPSVPVDAHDLGDGRSAWKPSALATLFLVFDNASGAVVARCGVAAIVATRDLGANDLSACTTGRLLLVGGTIRFTSALPALPAPADDAPPAVAVALVLTGGLYAASPQCFSDARSLGSDRFVTWHCIVVPRIDGRWSGRADLVAGAGWTIGTGPAQRRVCRFAHDADGSGAVDANAEHPADYRDVAATLQAQNFLVVRGDVSCPTAPAVRLTGEGAVIHADLGTMAHQP